MVWMLLGIAWLVVVGGMFLEDADDLARWARRRTHKAVRRARVADRPPR